jgi:hypothetical protein
MSWKDKLIPVIKTSPFISLYSVFGGLTEFWCCFFAVTGAILAFKGKLDGNYSLLITALAGLLATHDSLDDWFQHKREIRNGERILKDAIQPSDPTQK